MRFSSIMAMKVLLHNVCMCLALLLSGCMHYSAGTGSNLVFDRIFVPPVRNNSFATQAQAVLTQYVRNYLSQRPGVSLADSADLAAVLDITITDFFRSLATTKESDSVRAKSFDVVMVVSCTLTNSDGSILLKDYKVRESVECYAFDDYQEAQYQIMPRLAEKLAKKISELVCNSW